LDLRNCKIREVDCLCQGDFRNLKKLNFDNNLLVNLDCFKTLGNLRYLSLNSNKIERLLSTDPIVSPNNSGLANPNVQKEEMIKFESFLPNLEELFLGNNQISKIAELGLRRFKQLKVLYLHGNKISKVYFNDLNL
jgi:Leucine-rich repeat (LRR) protein